MRGSSSAFTRLWIDKRIALSSWAISGVLALGVGLAAVWNPVWSLAGFGALCAEAVVLRNPKLGALGLMVLLTFNDVIVQLLGLGSEGAQLFGGAKDGLLLVLVIAALLRLQRTAARLPRDLVYLVVVVFAVAGTSAIATPTLGQALYGLRNDFEPLLLLLLVPALFSREDSRHITLAVVAAGEVAALVAIVTHGLGIEWLLRLGYTPATIPAAFFLSGSGALRAFSPYIDPNALGLASVFVICVVLSRADWRQRYRYALLLLPTVALVLSLSRSALLGALVAGVLFAVRWLRKNGANRPRIVAVAVVFTVGGLISGVLLWGRQVALDPSVLGHLVSIADFSNLALQHPLGFGVGSIGLRAGRFTELPLVPESFFLLVALDAGLIALVAYLLVLGRAGLKCIIGARMRGLDGDMAFLGVVVLAASLPDQLTLLVMQDAAVSWLLWIVVGVALIHARSDNDAGNRRTERNHAARPRHGADG